jgi:hypothetical protein
VSPFDALNALEKEGRSSERSHGRRDKAMLAIALTIMALGIGALVIGLQVSRNTQGLRTACLLAADIITKAGLASGEPDAQPTDQQKLNALYLKVWRRSMTPEDRETERVLLARIARSGGRVVVPDCDEITKNPESVTTAR